METATKYSIKITGEGTREEIAKALLLIAAAIDGDKQQDLEDIDGAEWNDCLLLTEMKYK